jgi:hypothetical protein
MSEPSDIKSQVNRMRENNDPAGSSRKPMLDENKGAGLRGKDKQQGDLKQPSDTPPDSDITGGVGSQGGM